MPVQKQELKNCTDESLIEHIHAGQEELTDYILEKYKPLVRKKTNAMYLIGGETEDLIQEGMIGLFKAIRDFREEKESSFYHFAELCINRQLYSALEASNRKKHLPLNSYVSLSGSENEDGVPMEELLPFISENPEQRIIEQEIWDDFQKKLSGNLSKMEKQVLMQYLDGYNYIQIAKQMQKPPKSIDNALQRIRQKIRKIQQD